jgi:hypothetical protein
MVCKRRGRRDVSVVELDSSATCSGAHGGAVGREIQLQFMPMGVCYALTTSPSDDMPGYGNRVEACRMSRHHLGIRAGAGHVMSHAQAHCTSCQQL